MKILSIRIKNLASLAGEQFIDFESQPLANAGLIAITGKTGAGKSTILDAMCLALFNQIPRLKKSDAKLQDNDGTDIPIDSPLTVLRRGTSSGFAELRFIGQDGKKYLAYWEARRARDKISGKLKINRHIQCISDGIILADKTTQVNQHIEQITQLSFDKFTRSVLLAQSEVTAFLKARDSERGELLEYLTNSAIFAKIGQLAFEKTKEISNQRKELENALGHIEMLSDEDVATLTEQLQHSEQQLQQLNDQQKQLEREQRWFEQNQKLEEEVQRCQQQQHEQQQKVAALSPEREQLKQLETFAFIRPSVIQQQNMQAELNQLHPKIQSAESLFSEVKKSFNQEKNSFQTADENLKAQQQFEQMYKVQLDQVRHCIKERESICNQFRKAKTKLEMLQQEQEPLLQQQRQLQDQVYLLDKQHQQCLTTRQHSAQFSALDQGLSVHLPALQSFIQQLQQFEQQHGTWQNAQEDLKHQQAQLSHLQQQHGNEQQIELQLTQQREQHGQAVEQYHLLKLIHTDVQQYAERHSEYSQLQQACQQLNDTIQRNATQLAQSEQQYSDQKQLREQLQRILQQQQLLHTENIEKLREQLIEGEACLVCGSLEHPFKHDLSALSKPLLDLQQQQQQQALQLEQQLLQTWQQQQQSQHTDTATLRQQQARLTQLSPELEKLQQRIQQACSQNSIQIDLTQPAQNIEQHIAEQLERLSTQQKSCAEALKQLEELQKQQRQLQSNIQQLEQKNVQVQQSEHAIDAVLRLLDPQQQEMWQTHRLSTAQQLMQQLEQRQQLLTEINSLEQQCKDTQLQLQQKMFELDNQRKLIQYAESEQAESIKQGKDNTNLAIQLIFEMTQTQVEKPHEWLSQYDEQYPKLRLEFNQAHKRFEQMRDQFDAQQRLLDQLKTQQQQVTVQHQNATREIEQWLIQHPDFSLAQLMQLQQISHEQRQNMHQQVQHAERALADCMAALKVMQDQLQQHLTEQPAIEFAQLQNKLTALLATLQHAQIQRDEVKLKLELHQRNLEKQQAFAQQIQQIQQQEHRWGKISGLMGDSTGKKFRDFAQQYNLDILLEYANQQLATLSQRYTLKRLDHSLSLAIIDHDMDGEVRSVASLSGGESFLTALALSLAIANMASGSMKIESLFIDEGFGTLDASSLHMVMNALDQLQNQGRKVVLISHIQDMHERIPVQIQVQPLGSGASQIAIVG